MMRSNPGAAPTDMIHSPPHTHTHAATIPFHPSIFLSAAAVLACVCVCGDPSYHTHGRTDRHSKGKTTRTRTLTFFV